LIGTPTRSCSRPCAPARPALAEGPAAVPPAASGDLSAHEGAVQALRTASSTSRLSPAQGSRRHVRTVGQLPAGRVLGTVPCRCFPYASQTPIIAPPQLDVSRPTDLTSAVKLAAGTSITAEIPLSPPRRYPRLPRPRPRPRIRHGAGSGFFISADGYLVTTTTSSTRRRGRGRARLALAVIAPPRSS